jgi:hypothetical protein
MSDILESPAPRVVIAVEAGTRQLMGIYAEDENIPIRTGEIHLINPIQCVPAPADKTDGLGFAVGPLFATHFVDEMVLNASSIIEVFKDSKIYNVYLRRSEQFYHMQQAAAAGLTLAREMPKGSPIIGSR